MNYNITRPSDREKQPNPCLDLQAATTQLISATALLTSNNPQRALARMHLLRFICLLLLGGKIGSSRKRRHLFIPPVSEVGNCACQNIPNIFFWLDKPLFSRNHEIKFLLYTRASPGDEGILIKLGDSESLYSSNFDPNLPLTVITHGWIEGVSDLWVYPMKNELLRKANMNVIILDWESLSRSTYAMSVKFSRFTGIQLSNFLHFLKKTYPSFTGAQIHLIGFSMGAHVSGVAGNRFPGLARITGLDPAGPSYECVSDKEVLDASDADFVDIIHTNSGCLSRGHLGYRIPTAHQNFYVNGGGRQPGCPPFFIDAFADIIFGDKLRICHHTRSVEYFLDTINGDQIAQAFSCPDYSTFKTGACLGNFRTAFGYPATFTSAARHHGPLALFLDTQGQYPFLSKHIKIGAYVQSRGDGHAKGDVEIHFLLPTQNQQKITLLRYGTNVLRNKLLVNMITIPITMDIGSLNVSIAYNLPVFRRPAINDTLEIFRLMAVDVTTNEEYCVTSRVSITLSDSIIGRPRIGPC
ncbi:hepatic triacylglycerol lipase-like isoform X2 [Macrobrachium rosenbergii]|uniref:hepatic triacylglycerol lipase-like isoform X2 n=1 Tax=Macrobrachium rosenbergii TaxID=79674 RepID=UPI0034D425D7